MRYLERKNYIKLSVRYTKKKKKKKKGERKEGKNKETNKTKTLQKVPLRYICKNNFLI